MVPRRRKWIYIPNSQFQRTLGISVDGQSQAITLMAVIYESYE